MDRKGKIIEKEIFHFVCKIHFWQAQEDDFPFPPPYFEKKKKNQPKKLHQNQSFSVIYN